MKKTRIILILLPLILGVAIYVLYRSKNLYYFKFIHLLFITHHIEEARILASDYRAVFPTWFIYSLPDGLWLFGMGICFMFSREAFAFNYVWFTLIYIFTNFAELLQKTFGGHGSLIGTYDKTDVIAYLIAYISSTIISLIARGVNRNSYSPKLTRELFIKNVKYSIIFSILAILPSMI